MADEIRYPIDTDIEGKEQTGNNRSANGEQNQPQNLRIKSFPPTVKKNYCDHQHHADEIFAAFFENSEAGILNETVRENAAENRGDQKRCYTGHQGYGGKRSKGPVQKEGGREQTKALQIPSGDP